MTDFRLSHWTTSTPVSKALVVVSVDSAGQEIKKDTKVSYVMSKKSSTLFVNLKDMKQNNISTLLDGKFKLSLEIKSEGHESLLVLILRQLLGRRHLKTNI